MPSCGRRRPGDSRYPYTVKRNFRRRTGSAASWALVGTQGVLLLAILLVPSSWGPPIGAWRELGGALFLVGVIGTCASALHLGGALDPLPEPNGAGLRARGLYRSVRHPMYGSVIVASAGVACARGSVAVWVLVVLLGVLVEAKSRREERFLLAAYPGYLAYARRTGKFVPGVGTLK